jgi:hypothetical protein
MTSVNRGTDEVPMQSLTGPASLRLQGKASHSG